MLLEVTPEYVQLWLNMINDGTLLKDVYQYINLLTSFCTNNGAPMKEPQHSVRKASI